MKRFSKLLICLALTLAFLFAPIFYSGALTTAYASTSFASGELNPAFVQYVEDGGSTVQSFSSTSKTLTAASASAASYGYIPSPVIIKRTGKTASSKTLTKAFSDALPASYNTGFTQYQTAVQDQGKSGACWSFATLASMESFLLKNGAGKYNFSERNMMNNHGFDPNYLDGGNREMAVAYLARWGGPVNETDDYTFLPASTKTTGYVSSKVRKHVQDTLYIESRDFTTMKKAIREYGAIYTTMYMDQAYFKENSTSDYKNYYYSLPKNPDPAHPDYETPANHSVTLVGWDDNYAKENFGPAAENDGAFIVKNSWGPGVGKNGYFYISYYDTIFGQENYTFTRVDSASNYYREYQYDPLGWVNEYGVKDSNTCWFSNVFPAPKQNESLSAVAFYTTTPGATYEIYVSKSVSSTGAPLNFSSATPVAKGTQTYAGYHTINLSSITLTPSSKFAVAVKVTNPDGYNYSEHPVAVEENYLGYASKASASWGQSYLSEEGAYWTDVAKYVNSSANVCLKAFTKAGANAVTGISLSKTTRILNKGGTYQLKATVSPSSATNKNVVWRSSNTNVAIVSSAGLVTGKAAGTATITATTEAGQKAASCAVTVVSSTQVCNVAVSNVSGNSLRLSWSRLPVSGTVRYYIYYKTSASGSYKYLAYTTGSYKDIKGLANNTSYYFRVRARVSGVYKEYSATTAATKISVSTQVKNVKVSRNTKSSLRLYWTKIPLTGSSIRYYIYYRTSDTGIYTYLTYTTNSYKDIKNLLAGKTYYFKVRAKISGKYMTFSSEIKTKTLS
jgi:C1A family cysteine protease/uncharacterized protein YjdB